VHARVIQFRNDFLDPEFLTRPELVSVRRLLARSRSGLQVIGRACRLLPDTDRPITEIAFGCGFEALGNFNRQFRRRRLVSRASFVPASNHRRSRSDVGDSFLMFLPRRV